MRIRALEIEHFGLFSGREIAFSASPLQVVYGPNEAGKSTLLQLIRESLFGFAVRNPYVFDEHAGEMAAVVTLELADGRGVRFRRRKGRTKEVVGEMLDDGQPIDGAGLTRLLGHANSELFHNVFGFSLSELAAGQQSLQHARLSEALYGGALGGLTGFRQVLEDLEQEQQRLFLPTATKRTINQLLADLRTQNKQLRNAQLRPNEYEQLEQDVRENSQLVEQLRGDRDELQRRKQRCAQLNQAVGLWQRRQTLLAELAITEVPPDFPRDGDEQYERLRQQHDQVAAEWEDFRRELQDVQRQLSQLSPPGALIEQGSEIQRLAQQLDKIRGFRTDVDLRRQEAERVRAAISARLQDLDPSWSGEHLQRFQTGLARRASLESMQLELDELESQRRDLRAQCPALEADVATLTQQLEALSHEPIAETLQELLESAARYQSQQETLRQHEQQLREWQSRLQTLQQRLNAPFGHQLEALPELPVPMATVVSEFRQQATQLQELLQRCQLQVENAASELAQQQRQLNLLQAEERVPDRQQLEASRDYRDRGWKLIRRKFVEQADVSAAEIKQWLPSEVESLASVYEASVQRADEMADQRQSQAEVVARCEQLGRDIKRCQSQHEVAELARAEVAGRLEAWRQRWLDLWKPCGLEPESPDAMLEWLRLHGELTEVVAQRDLLQNHLAAQRRDIEQYETQLQAALPEWKGPPSALFSEARRRLQRAQEVAAERKACQTQLPRKMHQLATLRQELAAVETCFADWNRRWQLLLESFGLPTSWDIHTAVKVLAGLSEARLQQKEVESLELRVRDMRDGLEQFQRDVVQLCHQLAPELASELPEQAVQQLSERLERARQDAREQETLRRQQQTLTGRCESKQRQLEQVQSNVRRLCDAARVPTTEGLLDVARRVRHWFSLREEIETTDHQLRVIRGNESEDQFAAALATADPAALQSHEQMLRAELAGVEQRFQTALETKGILAERLREMDQSSQAAVLAQDLESTRSRLREAVECWAPLVLARAFMRQSMEQFEREHQPRLLVDVGQLLQRMTLGRYCEISRKLDEQGSLQVRQADGKLKEPHQLSTGTREQLYLAIRLAYVLHYCREAEPLPIVMDDVLVNFDDARAAETLQTLIDVSREVQVILLTCHQRTLQQIQASLPDTQPIVLPVQ